MATRIALTVSRAVEQNTNVSRFVLDAAKIIGLVEYSNGLVGVTFEARNGSIIQTFVDESFETIADAIEQSDYEAAVQAGLVQ
ncbi:hypothetical protein vBAbaMPhT2_182 [Acinetobacter phage vB_AbaM_PhT2]|uniref:Uncharacterized protein n=2 Tax=Hadassahvirus TaxID=2842716 RepID=A0A6B9SW02_9CAUD|nr:hypothetical protein HYP74_gp199 [Acinetobacter phage AbTZA1]YP_009887202.1 hypothetical protein HYQ24_gp182 [Acinetobacter phage vB_AbaM_PhT2]QQM13889.1 hypothetical protein CPT_Maestro_162 [Acinetobacter phage Maestro]QQM18643.1 hypothetical protein CPT_Morttis_157 [Acinetobacter phage Morttis]UQS94224.1 hypothetical protein ABNavy71_155 [Acinetobacter phage AB-Navy71]AZU98730.1 hypothetical protein [Acinetobacter phage AbTZA1]QHJ75794.1 hypothetical protein vBAbaMPhT2_182 [Acinetobacter